MVHGERNQREHGAGFKFTHGAIKMLKSRTISAFPAIFHRSMSETSFVIEHAKTGRSTCKECKGKIDQGAVRIGKATASFVTFQLIFC